MTIWTNKYAATMERVRKKEESTSGIGKETEQWQCRYERTTKIRKGFLKSLDGETRDASGLRVIDNKGQMSLPVEYGAVALTDCPSHD
jgi:hypothetical protein